MKNIGESWRGGGREPSCPSPSNGAVRIQKYMRIFVYIFCVISICALVSIRATKSLVLNIERASQNGADSFLVMRA